MKISVKQRLLATAAALPMAVLAIGLMPVVTVAESGPALAQTSETVCNPEAVTKNACSPCTAEKSTPCQAAKSPCNPCAAAKKPAANPCAAAETAANPCAAAKAVANPCAATKAAGNPCAAGNPDTKAAEVQSTMSVDKIVKALKAAPKQPVGKVFSIDEIQKDYKVMSLMEAVEIRSLGFDFDSYDVKKIQAEHLNNIGEAIVKMLKSSPDEVFFIEGHADAPGEDSYNQTLSRQRARQVKSALINVFGVPAKNIVAAGFGERHPKVKTDEREQANRRVTVRRITPLVTGNR